MRIKPQLCVGYVEWASGWGRARVYREGSTRGRCGAAADGGGNNNRQWRLVRLGMTPLEAQQH